jgi:dihydropteroate synthase
VQGFICIFENINVFMGKDIRLFIRCNGRLIDLSVPKVMGILNVTPDSFYANSRIKNETELLRKTEQMLYEGAGFIDIGGYSSRPGATDISEDEERKRLLPAVELLHKNFPGIMISVDTFRSRIAKEAVQAGACMINDISGGQADKKMFDTVAELKVPYILMHMRGTPQTMQTLTAYNPDPVTEINRFFSEKIRELHQRNHNDIIIDPGFGFAKTVEQNYFILNRLERFTIHRKPLLVGISRKSMLFKPLKTNPENARNATTVAHTIALLKGASILRVHDVKEAVEAVKIVTMLH